MDKVYIYGRLQGCPFCDNAKRLCEAKGYDFDFVEVGKDITKEALVEKVLTHTTVPPRTVPQIFIGEEYIGGFTEFHKHTQGE